MRFYLQKISGVYYYRHRIPKDLVCYFGRSEFKWSLKTTNHKSAKILVCGLLAKIEKVFMQIRSGFLTDDMVSRLVAEIIDERLANREKYRESCDSDYPYELETLQEWTQEWADSSKAINRGMLASGVYEGTYLELQACNVLDMRGIMYDKKSFAFKQFCKEMLVAEIKEWDIELERVHGNYENRYDEALREKKSSQQSVMKFKELIEIYEREKSSGWAPSTLEKNQTTHRQLLHILGNPSLDKIDRKMALDLRDSLLEYPSHIQKKQMDKDWRELSKLTTKRLSAKSIDFIFTQFATLINYAKSNDWNIKGNPASGLVKKRGMVGSSEHKTIKKRAGYDKEDIVKLINALGSIRKTKPDYYWIVLLLLYTGARANEICQLVTDDITERDGIAIIHIKENSSLHQQTKDHKEKIVPIHSDLLKIGFMDFVERKRANKAVRLWEGLRIDSNKKWNKDFGKWYNRTFKSNFTSKIGHDLHSFRHTFISWYVQNTELSITDVSILKSIVGHLDSSDVELLLKVIEDSKITLESYGGDKKISAQKEYIERLKYGVDISVL